MADPDCREPAVVHREEREKLEGVVIFFVVYVRKRRARSPVDFVEQMKRCESVARRIASVRDRWVNWCLDESSRIR